MTERDKKLLSGLGFFVVVAIFAVFLILPLRSENKRMKEEIEANREEIALMKEKEGQLPSISREHEERLGQMALLQEEVYPMLKSQEIDRLLMEKVSASGLSARKLQITMPEEAANVAGYGRSADDGSNPDGKDGIWLAQVVMEVTGSMESMDRLIDNLSLDTPGVRIAGLIWSSSGRTADALTGMPQQYDILNLQLEIVMSRKE